MGGNLSGPDRRRGNLHGANHEFYPTAVQRRRRVFGSVSPLPTHVGGLCTVVKKLRQQARAADIVSMLARYRAAVSVRTSRAPAGEHRRLDMLYDMGVYRCAVIVAHPDDETLWAGGTILMNPRVEWTVVTLCRGDDPDRAPRFHQAMQALGARGATGSLDDGAAQAPLALENVRQTILSLLPEHTFDLVITHSPQGEYTRHRRHEEVSQAAADLLARGELTAGEAWVFAYEDGGGNYLPRPIRNSDITVKMPEEVWQRKYGIITVAYGFGPDTFEARTTPRSEAFRRLQINSRQTEAAS